MPNKRISFARYRRVLQIMQDDPLLKRELSKKTVAINCGGQKFEDVPQEAVYVTQCISDDGIDPYTMPKVAVVNKAYDLLIGATRPDPLLPEESKLKAMEEAVSQPNGHVKALKAKKPELSRAEVKPKAVKAEKSKPKAGKPKAAKSRIAPPKDEEPEPEAPPPPKPKPKPKPAPKARVSPPKAKATTASPAVVEPVKPGVNGGAVVVEGKYLLPFTPPPPGQAKEILPGVPRVSGIAALNLVYAALNVFEPFMAEEGVKDLCDELTVWINKVHRLTILSSAEEKSAAG